MNNPESDDTDTAMDLPKTSNPATRALATIGITRLDQLAGHTEREIAALHGMGPKALGILRAALRRARPRLRQRTPDAGRRTP